MDEIEKVVEEYYNGPYEDVKNGIYEAVKDIDKVQFGDMGVVTFKTFCLTLPNGRKAQLWVHGSDDGDGFSANISYWEPHAGETVQQFFVDWEEAC